MKNGFTLIELLATILMILALALLITPKVAKFSNDSRNKGYKEIEKRLEEAAAKYIIEEYAGSTSTSIVITKDDLISKKYIGEIYDLKDKSECDATINVTDLNTVPNFVVHLTCSNYTS